MGWRTSGCGCANGVGCDHGQPTPLCVIQGESLVLSLSASAPVVGRRVRGEVWSQVGGGRLVLDLTPFCSGVVGDPFAVSVVVPGEVTAGVWSDGFWDVWVGAERLGFGPFMVERAVSRGGGRVLTVDGWSPVFRLGEGFERVVGVAGLLPDGEFLGDGVGVGAGEFVVSGVGGGVAGSWKGDPWVVVSADSDEVVVSLSVEDVDGLGVGRFTYSLVVFNDLLERRVVLAGVLMVVEGGGGGGAA